jgi:23S rRNA-/tRNA-specific pseudouridylate synthase
MITIEVLASGQGWAVLNKPAGIVVHADSTGERDLRTSFAEYLAYDTAWAQACQWNGSTEPTVVHRLDRDVSGVVIVAFDQRIIPMLHLQFENKTVRKVYYAWVEGRGPDDNEGLWKKALTKKAEGRSNPAGFAKMRVPSQTEYKVLERREHEALLELHPLTGRKHQLRRHCAMAGCAIIGDDRYGKVVEGLNRILLHAKSVNFKDPWNEQDIFVEAALPEDFEPRTKYI